MRRFAALLLAGVLAAACARTPSTVHNDLARDAPLAEWLLPGGIRVVLGPPVVVRPGLSFLRQRGEEEDVPVERHERTAFLAWRRLAPRDALLDLEASGAGESTIFLNEHELTRLALAPGRRRHRLPLPPEAQTRRHNRLRVVLPAGAALHAVVVGAPETLDANAASSDSSPLLDVLEAGGIPTLLQAGSSELAFVLRLPEAPELRFRPAPAPGSVADARLRVVLESEASAPRTLWSGAVSARDARREVALRLPGRAGTLARLALHVESGMAAWEAPRVLGEGAVDPLWSPPPPVDSERRTSPLRRALAGSHVMLVVLDAASARHFGCYGYERATTPEIDRLAAEGVLFENAYTPAAFTLSAMASLWTSLHPEQHHEGVRHSEPLPPDLLTVPELLQARGVHTAGFVSNPSAGRPFGLQRGFTEFHELYRDGKRFVGVPRAEDFREPLRRFLVQRRSGGRFLAYVHFLEPHFPYDPKPPFRTLFGPDGPLPESARRDQQWIRAVNAGTIKPTLAESQHLVRLYDGNLAAVDHELGRLRAALEAAGLWEQTVLILTADHGEALGEHGFIGHAPQVYEESVHIPLIARVPAGVAPPGTRLTGLADLLDLGPTLLEIFGVDPPKAAHLEGRSLLPMLQGAPGKPAVLSRTMAERPVYALREGRHKLIHSLRDGLSELYDLQADPLEAHDLADREPLRAEFYRQALYRWLRSLRRSNATGGAPVPLSEAEREALRALGYVQ